MEKWEYITEFIRANIEDNGVKEHIQSSYPNWKPKKYSPEAMEKHLNERGASGWEVVHLEPVWTKAKKDVEIPNSGIGTNQYFCVLKRRLPN